MRCMYMVECTSIKVLQLFCWPMTVICLVARQRPTISFIKTMQDACVQCICTMYKVCYYTIILICYYWRYKSCHEFLAILLMYMFIMPFCYIVTSVYSSLFVSSKFSNSGSASFWGNFSKHCLNLVQGVRWIIKEYAINSNKVKYESSPIRIIPMFEIQWTLLCTTMTARKQIIAMISIPTMWYVLTLADL